MKRDTFFGNLFATAANRGLEAVGGGRLSSPSPAFRVRIPGYRRVIRFLGLGTSGSSWVQLTAALQIVSAYTNYAGLRSVFDAGIAFLLAAGLQIMISKIGSRMTDTHRRADTIRMFVAWFVMATISVFFSYAAMDAAFHRHVTTMNAPLKQKQELRAAAQTLSDSITEARRLALRRLSNDAQYAADNVAKAQARLRSGAFYQEAADGEVALEQNQEALRQAKEQIDAWNALRLDTSAILQKPDAQAWAALQTAHQDLTDRWGLVRFGTATPEYKLPAYPTPPITGDFNGVRDEMSDAFLGPFHRLGQAGPVQRFFLFLSLALEAAPLLMAWSGVTRREEEPGIANAETEDMDPNEPKAGPPVYDPYDKRINRFCERRRGAYKVDDHPRMWARIDALIAPSVDAAQRARVASLDNLALQDALDAVLERITTIQESGERIGLPEEHLDRLIMSAWKEVEAEVNFQERLREGDRIKRFAGFCAGLMADMEKMERDQLAALGEEGRKRLRQQMEDLMAPLVGDERTQRRPQ